MSVSVDSVLYYAFIFLVAMIGTTIIMTFLRFMIEGDGGDFVIALFSKRGRKMIRDWWSNR
jgi:hypothetical protein